MDSYEEVNYLKMKEKIKIIEPEMQEVVENKE